MGSDYPPITCVVTSWYPQGISGLKRAEVETETIVSWSGRLFYQGDEYIHFADDGSELWYKTSIDEDWEKTTYSHQARHGVGASLNKGFKQAFESSPLVFYGVGDWSLVETFDLTPWARLLLEREDVGMVRLGPPHPNTTGTVEAFTSEWQSWGLRMDRYAYAFGHRPALYHKRMIDAYGWFKEDCNALVCEQDYAERFCRMEGPDIVLALPHPWQHLDSVELADVDPR